MIIDLILWAISDVRPDRTMAPWERGRRYAIMGALGLGLLLVLLIGSFLFYEFTALPA